MQRNSTRFFIYSILIMTILVVMASFLVVNFTTQFQNSESTNIVNAATSYAATNSAVIEDGKVATNYSTDCTTAINSEADWNSVFASGHKSSSNISGKYYLTTDLVLDHAGSGATTTAGSAGYVGTDYYDTFKGTLDGCGHTITVNAVAQCDGATFGGLVDNADTATFKNFTLVINKLRFLTTDAGSNLFAGGITGYANNVTFSNIKVEWNDMCGSNDDGTDVSTFSEGNSYWTMSPKEQRNNNGTKYYTFGGLVGSTAGEVTFNNCTLDLDGTICQMNWLGKRTQYLRTGGFIGEVKSTINMNGCSFLGAGQFFAGCETTNSRTCYVDTGAVIGRRDSGNIFPHYYCFYCFKKNL